MHANPIMFHSFGVHIETDNFNTGVHDTLSQSL